MTEQGFERAIEIKKELSTLHAHRLDFERSIKLETNTLRHLKAEHCPIQFEEFKIGYLQNLDAEIESLKKEFRKLY